MHGQIQCVVFCFLYITKILRWKYFCVPNMVKIVNEIRHFCNTWEKMLETFFATILFTYLVRLFSCNDITLSMYCVVYVVVVSIVQNSSSFFFLCHSWTWGALNISKLSWHPGTHFVHYKCSALSEFLEHSAHLGFDDCFIVFYQPVIVVF